uniref:MAPK regulated corepressor interacting protein 1 n=1 Tax=Equus asinus TaxID=9793 RepID=A0A9L0K762_EQUAS
MARFPDEAGGGAHTQVCCSGRGPATLTREGGRQWCGAWRLCLGVFSGPPGPCLASSTALCCWQLFRSRSRFRNLIGCKYWAVESPKDSEYAREVESKKLHSIPKEHGMTTNRIIDSNSGIFHCHFSRQQEPHGYQGIQELSRGMQRPRGSGSGVQGPDTPAMTSSPVSRVVYNGKRNSSPRSPPNSSEIFTPAHEENVRFIYEAWQGVERDLRSQMSGSERGLVEEYVEKVPNPSLKTFKPIDLSDLKRRNTQDTKKS